MHDDGRSPAELVPAVVAGPSQGVATSNHRAAEVDPARRLAERRRSFPLAGSVRPTLERLCRHKNVAFAGATDWRSDQIDQSGARRLAGRPRTGVIGHARLIDFACGDGGKAYLRAFCAPDRTVSVPDAGRSAGKGGSRLDHQSSTEQHPASIASRPRKPSFAERLLGPNRGGHLAARRAGLSRSPFSPR